MRVSWTECKLGLSIEKEGFLYSVPLSFISRSDTSNEVDEAVSLARKRRREREDRDEVDCGKDSLQEENDHDDNDGVGNWNENGCSVVKNSIEEDVDKKNEEMNDEDMDEEGMKSKRIGRRGIGGKGGFDEVESTKNNKMMKKRKRKKRITISASIDERLDDNTRHTEIDSGQARNEEEGKQLKGETARRKKRKREEKTSEEDAKRVMLYVVELGEATDMLIESDGFWWHCVCELYICERERERERE